MYEEVDDNEKPALFILCGNFRSRPFLFDGNAEREYKGKRLVETFLRILLMSYNIADLFATLAKLLSTFPSLLAKSQFLLIPGPTDPWTSGFIPQPALPDILVQVLKDKIPNITFGSNPCRVRYFSQELVIFREDLMGRMMRNAVRLKETASETDLRKAVCHYAFKMSSLERLILTCASWKLAGTNNIGSGSPCSFTTERSTHSVGLRSCTSSVSYANYSK